MFYYSSTYKQNIWSDKFTYQAFCTDTCRSWGTNTFCMAKNLYKYQEKVNLCKCGHPQGKMEIINLQFEEKVEIAFRVRNKNVLYL